MTKWHIRRIAVRVRCQLVTFNGPSGAESTGIVDLLAVRKNHREAPRGMKRGYALQIILVQVKGGTAGRPTAEDAQRMRATARSVRAQFAVLADGRRGARSSSTDLHARTRGYSSQILPRSSGNRSDDHSVARPPLFHEVKCAWFEASDDVVWRCPLFDRPPSSH
jgi:hypothetical protein